MNHYDRRSMLFTMAAAPLLRLPPVAKAAGVSLSGMRVDSVRRVFHNGEHNAFTDLILYKGVYYLTFRSCPDGHMVHPTSSILVLSSSDGREWRQVYRFRVAKRDTRDPHFLIYKDKLFVYTGTWYCGDASPERYDMNQHLGYGAWTDDGSRWHGPEILEGTYGHYIWRAAAFGGVAYLGGRRKRGFPETRTREERDPVTESALLESDDGLRWRKVGLFQETYGNETAFLFESDGSIVAVARTGAGRNAQLLISSPPYQEWRRSDLGRYIGGPLVVKWGNEYLVGGRKHTEAGPRTVLSRLVHDALEDLVELPSDGDNSYPGFVALSSTRGWVSYYSTHEKEAGKPITAIYLAELVIET